MNFMFGVQKIAKSEVVVVYFNSPIVLKYFYVKSNNQWWVEKVGVLLDICVWRKFINYFHGGGYAVNMTK